MTNCAFLYHFSQKNSLKSHNWGIIPIMLPFMKNKQGSTGLIVKMRSPDGPIENEPEDNDSAALEACAEDILRAISAKDSKQLAQALQSAFEVLESQPHDEAGEDEEKPFPHSYDAQNEK